MTDRRHSFPPTPMSQMEVDDQKRIYNLQFDRDGTLLFVTDSHLVDAGRLLYCNGCAQPLIRCGHYKVIKNGR